MIIDFIGATYWTKNIASLAQDGRMVMLGLMGGTCRELRNHHGQLRSHSFPIRAGTIVQEADLSQILYKRLRIQGSTLRARSIEYQAALISR